MKKKPASWVIVDRSTNAAVLEIYQESLLPHLDTEKYKAVPILQYLENLNRKIRETRQVPARDIFRG